MKKLLLPLSVFFLLLGPKLGIFDTAVFVPAALLMVQRPRALKIPRGFAVFAVIVMFLICYQMVIQGVNETFAFDAVARLVRSLAQILLVGVMFGSGYDKPSSYWIRVTVGVIAVHSVIVIAGALVPEVNRLSALSIDIDRIRPYRSSGLLAGYDAAGLLSIFGLLQIVFFRSAFRSKWLSLVLCALFICAAAFASRVSFAIALVIATIWVFRFLLDKRIRFLVKMPVVFISVLGIGFAFYYFMLIISATFSIAIPYVGAVDTSFIARRFAVYARGLPWLANMFFLPSSPFHLFFGTGSEVAGTDVGYVREIFRYGVFGLIVAVGAHLIFLLMGSLGRGTRVDRFNASCLVFSIMGLMFLLTFKNNYIFLRAIFPAFLIVVGAVLHNKGLCRREQQRGDEHWERVRETPFGAGVRGGPDSSASVRGGA